MGDPRYSRLVCARPDKDVFEKMGYQVDGSEAFTMDGHEISGALVMVDEEADGGHYEDLIALTGVPFLVSNGSCPGAYGDHLIVSDGKVWHYCEALHESNYPAVRAEFGGVVRGSEVDEARKYWELYSAAVAATKRAVVNEGKPRIE